MYWYIKYPLIALSILACIGIVCLILRSCNISLHSGDSAMQPEEFDTTITTPELPTSQPTSENDSQPGALKPTPVQPTSHVQPGSAQSAPSPIKDLESRLEIAQKQYEQGQLEAARRLAQLVLKDSRLVEFDKYWFRAADLINQINRTFMNSTAPCAEKKRYMVIKGDSLQKIANKKLTTPEFLLRMNPGYVKADGGTPVIHPTDTIFYMEAAWKIRVIKQRFILILYNNDELYRYYKVSIGRENRTPVGNFVISERQKHPSWTPPGKNIPYGDPENILGTHWLRLTPAGETASDIRGYGIHGTWDENSIGTPASAGCIRMLNSEVEEIFDIVPTPGRQAPLVYVTIEE